MIFRVQRTASRLYWPGPCLQAHQTIQQLQLELNRGREKLADQSASLKAVKQDHSFMKEALARAQQEAADAAATDTVLQRHLQDLHEQHCGLQTRAESAEAACAVAQLLHEDHLEQMQVGILVDRHMRFNIVLSCFHHGAITSRIDLITTEHTKFDRLYACKHVLQVIVTKLPVTCLDYLINEQHPFRSSCALVQPGLVQKSQG